MGYEIPSVGANLIQRFRNQFSSEEAPQEQILSAKELFTRLATSPTFLHNCLVGMHVEDLDSSEVGLYLLHYLHKGANWSSKEATQMGRPLSSFNPQSLQTYHREYLRHDMLFTKVTRHIASEVNQGSPVISEREIGLLGNAHFKESLESYADVFNLTDEAQIDGIIDLLIASTEGKEDVVDAPKVYIFVDQMIDRELPYADRIKKVKDLNEAVVGRMEARLKEREVPPKQATVIRFGLSVASQQEFKGLTTLILPIDKTPQAQRLHGFDIRKKFLFDHIPTGGYTPSMTQCSGLIHSIEGSQAFANIRPTGVTVELEQFANPGEFMDHAAVQNYAALGAAFRFANKADPSAVELLSSANYRMLMHLEPSLEVAMQDPAKAKLINASLNRLAALMNLSAEHCNNHTTFSLYHELISEEVLLLLNICQPYQEGAFHEIFLENREHGLGALDPEVGPEALAPFDPTVVPMHSGMACVDGIVRSLRQDKPNLGIACLDDNYFETFNTLGEMSGTSIDGKQKPNFYAIEATDIGGSISKLKADGKDPDLVFLDLRPSPSMKAKSYDTKDLNEMTTQLLKDRKAETPLTLAVDITLDKMHSKEFEEFLNEHHQAIEDGRLNVVLYRSGHKFDQLGVDKFNAGYMQVYTTNEALRGHFENLGGTLEGLDYQALCHFHKSAHIEMHQYVKKHYKNTNVIYQRLESLISNPTSFLSLTPKSDTKSYYLEFQYPKTGQLANRTQSLLMDFTIERAKRAGVNLTFRDSFGFNESSIASIGSPRTRLSVGTHSPEELEVIAQIFSDFEQAAQEALVSVGELPNHEAFSAGESEKEQAFLKKLKENLDR
ncbi:hypothetical protein [Simkania sp.]|uniref:hypothetical protein n=1 Tax=Simkania sp. TaxID=34094 RepID=UPI003B523EA0